MRAGGQAGGRVCMRVWISVCMTLTVLPLQSVTLSVLKGSNRDGAEAR